MTVSQNSLPDYYARRASEYERVYQKPERQEDIAIVRKLLQDTYAEKSVLEIACGTGYWTLPISETARSITATDVNDEVLEIAMNKPYPAGVVSISQADAYTLDGIDGHFSAAFGGFWFSHLPKSRRIGFLGTLHRKLLPGSLVLFLDNSYVEGSNNSMADHSDEEGNTYSLRRLDDGSEWTIIKNFPTEDELRHLLSGLAEQIEYHKRTYYWWVSYRLPSHLQG